MAWAAGVDRCAHERRQRVRRGLLGMPHDVLYTIADLVQKNNKFFGTALASSSQFFYYTLGGLNGARERRRKFAKQKEHEKR